MDALKAIKEKEDAVDAEIREFARKQEELLEEKRRDLAAGVEDVRKSAQREYESALEKVRSEVSVRCAEIIASAEKEADGMKLKVSKAELEDIVNRLILSYLEE